MRTRQDGGDEALPRPSLEDEATLGPNPEDAEAEDDLENPEADADEAGGDDAGTDGDETEGPEAEDDVTPPPRRGGGSQTIRAQRARAQAAERRAEEAERRIAALESAQRQPPIDPQAVQRAEQEWLENLEMMTPSQQAQAVIERGRREFGGALNQLRFEQQDLADQTRFDASCNRYPHREAYRDRVETYRREQLARGYVLSREDAFHLLYARDIEAKAMRAAPRQRAAAAARVNGQQTRPTGARSNIAPQGRRPAAGSLADIEAQLDAAIARGEEVF
jgi:hypothetical protein